MLRCDQCDSWDNGICTNRDSDHWQEQMEPGEWCLDYEPKGGQHARLDMREHGLQYKLYCKVTGACVSGKGRDKACPLHEAKGDRKTGQWVYNSPVTMKCNQCGLVIKDWDWHRFKICPNCGAAMRGEQE